MRIQETKVYEFKELGKEAKQRAIYKWYENEDYPFLEQDLLEQLKEADYLKIFSNVKLQYSLSCCQGDGLSFSADIDILAWLKNRNMKTSLVDIVFNTLHPVKSQGNGGHYSFCSKRDIVYDIQDDVGQRTAKLIETIAEEITEYYLDICRKLEKSGYTILEYRMDENEFSEHCESNGYEFWENGDMA